MPSVNDNKTDKKKRLLESAFELFLDKSVNSTAVDDVVKGAGVARVRFIFILRINTICSISLSPTRAAALLSRLMRLLLPMKMRILRIRCCCL